MVGITAHLNLDMRNQYGYNKSVIKSFAHKGVEDFFFNGSKKGIQARHAQKLADILDRLNASNLVTDMNYPGASLHQLKGKMRIRKRPPTHPGGILKRHYLEPLSLTITELSKRLGVSRKTLSKIINEHGSVTPEMALRLSKAFNTTPELWLNLQQNYDLWHASRKFNDWKMVESIAV